MGNRMDMGTFITLEFSPKAQSVNLEKRPGHCATPNLIILQLFTKLVFLPTRKILRKISP